MPNENNDKLVTLADLAGAYTTLYNRDVMTSTDKTKLDGIEAGAEVNPDIANNLTETTTGKVLDATQGKILKDAIDNLDAEINSLDAEDVGAIKDDYNYTYMGSPYTGNELILLHNTTTGVNSVTDVASFLSSASGGSGTNQGALIHYTKTISVSAGSTAQTFPNSGTDDNITEDMIVLQAVISNPAAQGSDWTFTTANGTVTLNGTVNAATNVTLYFGVQMSVAPSIKVNLASTSPDNILKANPQPGVMGVLGTANGGTGVNATDAADLRSKLGAVAKSGDTMSGTLTIDDANTTPNQYAEIARFKRPAMRDDDNVLLYLGKAFSTKNCGTILYHHAGDGSNSNYLALSAYNAAQSLRSYADGHIELSQPLGVPYGGTGATTPGLTPLSNLGLKVTELILNFSNGAAAYTFDRDVFVVGCCGVGTVDIIAVSRVNGYRGFMFINTTNAASTGNINVDVCYIER